jgi:hypothetical protein
VREWKSVSGPAFLPAITNGETLYSWIGHYHRLSGNGSQTCSSMQIFGDEYAGFKRVLPMQLEHFVSITKGAFGDEETLAFERSLLGICAPFLSEDLVQRSLQLMKYSTGVMSSNLGLRTNRFKQSNKLKACPDCMEEDKKKFFITKWYLEHQWPTAWVCRKHRTPLRVLNEDIVRRNRKGLLLPQDVFEAEWGSVTKLSPDQIKNMIEAVNFSANFANRRQCNLDHDFLRYSYLIGAKRHKWVRTDGLFDSAKVFNALQSKFGGLISLAGLQREMRYRSDKPFFLKPLDTLACGYRQHPIANYLLMALLFDSPNEFDTTYEQVQITFLAEGTTGLQELVGFKV